MDPNRGSSGDAPSCSVAGGPRVREPRNGSQDEAATGNQQVQQQQQEHNIFGDSNLNMVFAFMLLLHFMHVSILDCMFVTWVINTIKSGRASLSPF